jgi:hypothetical protein
MKPVVLSVLAALVVIAVGKTCRYILISKRINFFFTTWVQEGRGQGAIVAPGNKKTLSKVPKEENERYFWEKHTRFYN